MRADGTIGSAFNNGQVQNVFCPSGTSVIGGGCAVDSTQTSQIDGFPFTGGFACHFATSGINQGIHAYAVCATVQ